MGVALIAYMVDFVSGISKRMTIGVGSSVVNALFEKGVGYKRKGDKIVKE